MPLFKPKTIARHLGNTTLSHDHKAILGNWSDLITSKRIETLKETALHGEFTSKIVEGVLGYKGPVEGADFTVATEKAILKGSVDLALGHFSDDKSEIIAPFELKGAKTKDLDAIMPGRAKSPVCSPSSTIRQICCFA